MGWGPESANASQPDLESTEAGGVRTAVVSLVSLLVAACDAPVPERPIRAGGTSAVELVVEPLGGDRWAWPASHYRVRGTSLAPNDVLLVRGELSDYHLARIDDRDLPKTLLERVIQVSAWSENGEVLLVPRAPVDRAETVSIAAPELGLIGTVQIADDAPPLIRRIWPPVDAVGGSEHAIYCADADLGPYPLTVDLEPGHARARVVPGIDDRGSRSATCVGIEIEEPLLEGEFSVPPIALGTGELDPAPLVAGARKPLEDVDCAPAEIDFGPGCAEVWDDRAIVRSPETTAFWAVLGDPFVLQPGARFVLKGFEPQTSTLVHGVFNDLSGNTRSFDVLMTTSSLASHVVINEVLANPLGAEPAQEWIELVNDGLAVVDLADFELADSAASITLPAFELAPGAFVIVARDDFDENSGTDVLPAPATAILRVPTLAKNGLSNSGERVELRRPDGTTASSFPAAPKPKAGISVARRSPSALDVAESFALHGAPGASPGAANTLP